MASQYLSLFVENYIKAFRRYNSEDIAITMSGIGNFIKESDCDISFLVEMLKNQRIKLVFDDNRSDLKAIPIVVCTYNGHQLLSCSYQIQDVQLLARLASEVGLSTTALVILKAIAYCLGQLKTLFKAIVLDLDDTLWEGTLSEVGAEGIIENLKSERCRQHISFMHFVRSIAEDLGIFVAICSRNDDEEVRRLIETVDESIFPLKNQIDCLVANNNPKSENIASIADQLSILPGAMVFIDDNPLNRDEVRSNLPAVYVPEWTNLHDLENLLLVGCIFDRQSISLRAQNRRRNLKIIRQEKKLNDLPALPVRFFCDEDHVHSIELYAKSNNFNFSQVNGPFEADDKSVYLNIYRPDGEFLDVCSTITYAIQGDTLVVKNWAMSCRFFEIGVEEAVLLHLKNLAGSRRLVIYFEDSGLNRKAKMLIEKYPRIFIKQSDDKSYELILSESSETELDSNTNLVVE